MKFGRTSGSFLCFFQFRIENFLYSTLSGVVNTPTKFLTCPTKGASGWTQEHPQEILFDSAGKIIIRGAAHNSDMRKGTGAPETFPARIPRGVPELPRLHQNDEKSGSAVVPKIPISPQFSIMVSVQEKLSKLGLTTGHTTLLEALTEP